MMPYVRKIDLEDRQAYVIDGEITYPLSGEKSLLLGELSKMEFEMVEKLLSSRGEDETALDAQISNIIGRPFSSQADSE